MNRWIVRSLSVAVLLSGTTLVVRAGEDGDADGGRGRNNINSRHVLAPPPEAANQDATGSVQLLRNPVRDAIHVRVFALDPGVTYNVMIARGDESELLGTITTVGLDGDDDDDAGVGGGVGDDDDDDTGDEDDEDDADGAPGSGKLKLDTKRGDTLPLGAESVADLVGTMVRVMDPDGNPALMGAIDKIRRPDGGRGPVVLKFAADPLEGAQEVPPVETEASGRASIKLKEDGTLIYELTVANILGVTQAHIHVGAAGENGPAVAFLFGLVEEGVDVEGEETIAEGTLTDDDISDGTVADLVARMEAGMAYVNVHTLANPPGEIRGQIGPVERGDDDDHDGGGDDDDDDGGAGGGTLLLDTDLVPEPSFALPGLHDASFRRGDANLDGAVDISDVTRSLMTLFQGSPHPYCMDAMDANDDGEVDISDPVATLIHLFRGGAELPAPGADGKPGFDPTADMLFCDEVRLPLDF